MTFDPRPLTPRRPYSLAAGPLLPVPLRTGGESQSLTPRTPSVGTERHKHSQHNFNTAQQPSNTNYYTIPAQIYRCKAETRKNYWFCQWRHYILWQFWLNMLSVIASDFWKSSCDHNPNFGNHCFRVTLLTTWSIRSSELRSVWPPGWEISQILAKKRKWVVDFTYY